MDSTPAMVVPASERKELMYKVRGETLHFARNGGKG